MVVYGYCRCSTDESKQDVNRQLRDLVELGVERKNIYKEYVSGASSCKTELNKVLALVKAGDTIVATEVSRITRSTKQLCEILEFAQKNKIKLVFGSFVVDCTKDLDAMTEGMLKMMGVFSEIERNMIRERVKSGIANARSKGKQIGRKRTSLDDIPAKVKKVYDLYSRGEISKGDYAKQCSISRPTLDKYLGLIEAANAEREQA